MTTILPCPFCGHENVEIDEVGIGEFAVDCPECLAVGPIAGDIMSAIAQYNGALQRLPNVSVTPAGGGDISPAAANRSTSLAKKLGRGRGRCRAAKAGSIAGRGWLRRDENPNLSTNGVTMKQPTIGAPLEGGTFGGIINVNGQHKGVIWSPKNAGQISTILLPSRKIAKGDYNPCDCTANMRALLASGSPAAQQVEAMDINGYKDWVIPSRDVLELGYRHFKPTNRQNYCSWRDGENPNSVPPGWIYTENMPAQTSIEEFQDNGKDAFDEAWYWSSTVLPGGKTAFGQGFDDGGQLSHLLSYEGRVRSVRLIQLGS